MNSIHSISDWLELIVKKERVFLEATAGAAAGRQNDQISLFWRHSGNFYLRAGAIILGGDKRVSGWERRVKKRTRTLFVEKKN